MAVPVIGAEGLVLVRSEAIVGPNCVLGNHPLLRLK